MSKDHPLIEEFLPIKAISKESIREKLAGRDFHLSTLHWWWARRPLAAARAAAIATLVPAAAFPARRDQIEDFFSQLTAWRGDEVGLNPVALNSARALIKTAWTREPPKVLDSFAGGCAIPLELLRLGSSATAVELNPVAYIVGMGTVVWPQQFGTKLADDVGRWAEWVREQAYTELSDLYLPMDPNKTARFHEQLSFQSKEQPKQLVPVLYLWTRTVRCPNPARSPHNVPLVRAKHVVRKPERRIALRVVPDSSNRSGYRFELQPDKSRDEPKKRTKSSSSACYLCGAHISAEYLKAQGDAGAIGHELLAVVCSQPGKKGKFYVSADLAGSMMPEPDELDRRLATLAEDGLTVPDDVIQPTGNAGLASGETFLYGIRTFGDAFTKRQLITLLTLCKYVRDAHKLMSADMPKDRVDAVAGYLGMIVNKVVDRSNALCRWHVTGEKVESPFVRGGMPMVWDFAEVNPFAGISGDFAGAMDAVCKVIRHCARAGRPADLRRGSATDLPFPDATFDAAIVDPPYYDNISYANSSDFYYIWLKRTIGHLFPEHFAGPVAPKKNEIIAAAYRHGKNKDLAKAEYERGMTQALEELKRVLKPNAPLVVVYAHQTTAGWSTLIQSIRLAGFTVVEAWPLDTEMTERRGGRDNASLASSIFLVARRRAADGVGGWDEVESEFHEVISERIQTLPALGISGADLVIATIGAALRPYTRFKAVELPNGEPIGAEGYLYEVQTAVIKAILSDLMGVSRPGVEAVDPVTQLYIIARFEYGDGFVPFDEMNTLVHGVLAGAGVGGVELGGARGLTHGAGALAEQDEDLVRLRDYADRGGFETLGVRKDSRTPPVIDALHRLLWLAEHDSGEVRDYLALSRPDPTHLRLVAQALAGSALSGKGVGTSEGEKAALNRLLASWKRLVEENLFGAYR